MARQDDSKSNAMIRKDQKAKDLMFGAPSPMPEDQVREAGVEIIKEG